MHMVSPRSLTFPQLLTRMGKEQKQNTPRARSSSLKLFTLKALGSSKDRAAEGWLDCLAGNVPEAAAA